MRTTSGTRSDLVRECYLEMVEGQFKPVIADLTPPGLFSTMGWVLNRINVPSGIRGQGHRSRLLQRICDDADLASASIHLCLNPTGPLDRDALEAWYLRYGFVADDTEPGWFIRHPHSCITRDRDGYCYD